MRPEHKPNVVHAIVAIIGALTGLASGIKLASPASLPPIPCPVCEVCPEVIPPVEATVTVPVTEVSDGK